MFSLHGVGCVHGVCLVYMEVGASSPHVSKLSSSRDGEMLVVTKNKPSHASIWKLLVYLVCMEPVPS